MTASFRITQTFADGGEFEVEVTAETSYPQVVAELKAAGLSAWAELVTE